MPEPVLEAKLCEGCFTIANHGCLRCYEDVNNRQIRKFRTAIQVLRHYFEDIDSLSRAEGDVNYRAAALMMADEARQAIQGIDKFVFKDEPINATPNKAAIP